MQTPRQIVSQAHAMSRRPPANWFALDHFVTAMRDRDFVAVAGFCAIGLLLTAGFIHSFANFDDAASALGLMP